MSIVASNNASFVSSASNYFAVLGTTSLPLFWTMRHIKISIFRWCYSDGFLSAPQKIVLFLKNIEKLVKTLNQRKSRFLWIIVTILCGFDIVFLFQVLKSPWVSTHRFSNYMYASESGRRKFQTKRMRKRQIEAVNQQTRGSNSHLTLDLHSVPSSVKSVIVSDVKRS